MQAETSVPPPISFPLPRKRRLFTTFEIAVVVLGLLALAYLLSMLMRPQLIAQMLGAAIERPAAQTETAATPAPKDSELLAGLSNVVAQRQSMGELESIPTTKPEAQLQHERDAEMAARVAALQAEPATPGDQAPAGPPAETAVIIPDPPAEANPPAAAPATRMGEVDLPPTPGALVTGSVQSSQGEAKETEAPPAPVAKVLNAQPAPPPAPPAAAAKDSVPAPAKPQKATAAAKATTPAAAPAPTKVAAATPPSSGAISFGPATVSKAKDVPEVVGIKIGRFGSIDDARLRWLMVTAGNGDALDGLEGRYVAAVGESGAVYDVIAGPINSTAEAKSVCKTLKARGFECSVGAFIGNAL